MPFEDVGGAVVVTGAEDISKFRMLVLRSALYLETKGLKHSGGSVYAKVKKEFNLKGNKRKVYELFCAKFGLTVMP